MLPECSSPLQNAVYGPICGGLPTKRGVSPACVPTEGGTGLRQIHQQNKSTFGPLFERKLSDLPKEHD